MTPLPRVARWDVRSNPENLLASTERRRDGSSRVSFVERVSGPTGGVGLDRFLHRKR
jgi:hypothetical protein